MRDLHEIREGETMAKDSATGGTVKRFIVRGNNVFYPWQMIENKARGGCPICAPWVGASPRGTKKHGFLRDLKASRFDVRGDVATFTFRQPENKGYPWSMGYYTVASVHKGELKMSLTIESLDGRAPVLPGFHPYFACHDASKVEVVAGEKFQGFSSESKMIPLASREIGIHIPGKRNITMGLGGDFFSHGIPQMVFWSDTPEKFFCVEPILQDKKLFDTPDGCFLEKGQKLFLEMSIKVL